MGLSLIKIISQSEGVRLGACVGPPTSDKLGSDSGELAGIGTNRIAIVGDLNQVVDRFDVLIDFTRPEVSLDNAQLCAAVGKPIVIGATGLSTDQEHRIKELTHKIPICMDSNFSTGVALCLQLLRQAASSLAEEAVDVEIIEAHHRHKLDAPSGTALSMGKVIAETLGLNLQIASSQRNDLDGPGIGVSSIRGGDIVGEHSAWFSMQGERIEITHKASSREAFARGAVRAAKWLVLQPPSLYSMQDLCYRH